MGTLFLLLTGVVWASVGSLLHAHVRATPDGAGARALMTLGWALLWPVLLVVEGATRPASEGDEQQPVDNLADLGRIAELERELGLALPTDVAAESAPRVASAPAPVRGKRLSAPKTLPHLPGTNAEACTLLAFGADDDFDSTYGYTHPDLRSRSNLAELGATLDDLTAATDEFSEYAETHTGPDVMAMAEVSLRRIGRIEGSLAPLFAGLTYADYGRARKGCIQARAAIGDVLDRMAVSGRL